MSRAASSGSSSPPPAEHIATAGNVAAHLSNLVDHGTATSVADTAASAMQHVPEPFTHGAGQLLGAAVKVKKAVDVVRALDPQTRASAGRLLANAPSGYGTGGPQAPHDLSASDAFKRASKKVVQAKVDETMQSVRKSRAVASAIADAAASGAASLSSSGPRPNPTPAPEPASSSTPLLRSRHASYGTF